MISTYILRKIMRPLRLPLFAKGIIIISIIAVFGVTLEYEGLNELGTIRRGIWNFAYRIKGELETSDNVEDFLSFMFVKKTFLITLLK